MSKSPHIQRRLAPVLPNASRPLKGGPCALCRDSGFAATLWAGLRAFLQRTSYCPCTSRALSPECPDEDELKAYRSEQVALREERPRTASY